MNERSDEKYARESFTLRRMKRWQIGALAIVALIVAVAGWWWVTR